MNEIWFLGFDGKEEREKECDSVCKREFKFKETVTERKYREE